MAGVLPGAIYSWRVVFVPVYIGGDVSKGYADFCVLNDDGKELDGSGRYDDTPEGHAKLESLVRALSGKKRKEVTLGVEATGGLERNWLKRFSLLRDELPVRVRQLNPFAVKLFLDAKHLHRAITDAHSAEGIAHYLLSGLRPLEYSQEMQEERALYRYIGSQVRRLAAMKTRFKQALVTTHPDLVRYADDLPQWLLTLVLKFPTALALAAAKPAVVAAIPYLGKQRAIEVVEAAKSSVASCKSAAAAILMTQVAGEVAHLESTVAEMKKQLVEQFTDDKAFAILCTLPGFGAWTAVGMRIEVGDFCRFSSHDAVISHSGLDPRPAYSGDGGTNSGISKRGSRHLRAALYLAAMRALKSSTFFRAFYDRLRNAGKSHNQSLVACMGKLVRVAYACVIRGRPYSADQHEMDASKRKQSSQPANPNPPRRVIVVSEGAPVSRREAKRRKAAQTQTRSESHNSVSTTAFKDTFGIQPAAHLQAPAHGSEEALGS